MKASKVFTVVVFLSVLFFVMIAQLFGIDLGYANVENRKEVSLPTLDFSDVKQADGVKSGAYALYRAVVTFRNEFDNYCNNNLVFRVPLFSAYYSIENDVFHARPLSSKVVEGEDGWFFLGDEFDCPILESKGLSAFSQRELESINRNLGGLKTAFEKEGFPVVVAIAPNKHTVYGQYLPIEKADRPNKYDQVRRAIGDVGLPLVNLDRGFKDYKDALLFYKTDSHWNFTGGYIAYRSLVNDLQVKFPEIRVLQADDFDKVDTVYSTGGNARMLNLVRPESDIAYHLRNHPTAYRLPTVFDNPQDNIALSRYSSLHFKSKANKLKVLVFRDSFCTAMVPFLKESFGETIFIWTNDVDWTIVKKINPDLVIYEFVERRCDFLLSLK